MPEKIKNNFLLNAKIIPASDDDRSQFLAINPGFRAEFGDKEASESAFLRFEVTEASAEGELTGDVVDNLFGDWKQFRSALTKYQPGIEWQLFSVGIDETQMATTTLGEDEEILRLLKEIKGEAVIEKETVEVEAALSEKENVKTSTVVRREQGYDVVENLNVAEAVDLAYQIEPGRGILSKIILGDRKNFDTACLQLLSLGVSEDGCDLPNNRFSFLLKLDTGENLVASPLSIDEGESGSYYVKRNEKVLLRLANPTLSDAEGRTSGAVDWTIRPAEIAGVESEDYFVATLTVDLNWLLADERRFPVTVTGGFFVDGLDFFASEKI